MLCPCPHVPTLRIKLFAGSNALGNELGKSMPKCLESNLLGNGSRKDALPDILEGFAGYSPRYLVDVVSRLRMFAVLSSPTMTQ